MNGTLSFYEYRFSGVDTQEVVGTLKHYLLKSNLFELFALRGGGAHSQHLPRTLCALRLLVSNEPPSETFITYYF